MSDAGKWLFFIGLGLAALGGLIWLVARAGLPIGRLPGDIRFEREGFSLYIPVASSILLSVLLTIALTVIARLFRK